MKNYKYFLMVTTIVSSLVPFSLSAVTPDELVEVIERSRVACCAPKSIEATDNGWFSSFRKSAGNAMRWAGDQMRVEETKTGAGKLKEAAKEAMATAATAKVGFSVKASIFNPLGNAMRWAGQRIKGGEETQKQMRTIVNNLGLNKSAKDADIADALRTAAAGIIKTDVTNSAPEDFLEVVKGLNNRGHSTKSIDALGIFVEELVLDKVMNTPTKNFAEFANSFKQNEIGALQNITPVRMATTAAKHQAMLDYLEAAYDKAKAQVSLN
ncbi:MAG TPA: hypothetical protein VMW10_07315 [Alphaproteobacteria bacterium]|nr:hypothetical protein [Alphaproteobacteria bacterium]